jgi:arginyl-tRNA synthetase
MNLTRRLQNTFRDCLAGLVADPAPYAVMVKPAQDARFGDYQANCAMSLAKVLGKKPPEIAKEIVARLPLTDWLQPPEIAGPGFINLRVRDDWLATQLRTIAGDERLGVEKASPARKYVIDYSSPNVAKPMHVGHLRSTIIGDALKRLLKFLGHEVISDNHLGDWGTQFGILLYGYKYFLNAEAFSTDPVRELARLYVHIRSQLKSDEDAEADGDPLAEACRLETAKLHAGDPENVRLWKLFMPSCQEEIDRIYRRLDVTFDYTRGESYYNPMLPAVVSDLQAKGLAVESKGALVIFFGDPEKDAPAIVRKRDGAFTYTTTDLATIQTRMKEWTPDAILYVVDFRQGQHFKNLFTAARRWGYEQVELQHISFGSVLGPDGKPFGARKGKAPELGQLLDDSFRRAEQVYYENKAETLSQGQEADELTAEELAEVFKAVGVGAVKYADLGQNRTSDYAFDLNKMVSTKGNTATYMQYAYARVQGIFRKGNVDSETLRKNPPAVLLTSPYERALAMQLLRLGEALDAAAAEYLPHIITAYLWDVAKTYSGFFQNCPVLKAETPELQASRLVLCDLTGRTIRLCLHLLGIRTMERI